MELLDDFKKSFYTKYLGGAVFSGFDIDRGTLAVKLFCGAIVPSESERLASNFKSNQSTNLVYFYYLKPEIL